MRFAQADGMQVSALVARAKRGDRDAFDELVGLYTPQVYNLSLRITSSREEAEDCVQEAFVRAFCGLRRFRGEAAFSTWLYRVALNVAADAARKRSRAPVPASALAGGSQEEPGPELDEVRTQETAGESEPEAELVVRQRRRVVLEAVGRLPPHHREVVALCDLQGLSYEEVARVTRTRVGTVKSRLNRARLALKDLLAPHLELLRD